MPESDAIYDDDHVILNLLVCEASYPWTIDECVREHGSHVAAEDALARLHAAGLVHRLQDFVWPTRAAMRVNELRIGMV